VALRAIPAAIGLRGHAGRFRRGFPPREMGKHEVLRDSRVWAWDDMSTGLLCELFHTLVVFSGRHPTLFEQRREARPSRARRALAGCRHNVCRHTSVVLGRSGAHRFRRDRIRPLKSFRGTTADAPGAIGNRAGIALATARLQTPPAQVPVRGEQLRYRRGQPRAAAEKAAFTQISSHGLSAGGRWIRTFGSAMRSHRAP
jgi:hypothetical protein